MLRFLCRNRLFSIDSCYCLLNHALDSNNQFLSIYLMTISGTSTLHFSFDTGLFVFDFCMVWSFLEYRSLHSFPCKCSNCYQFISSALEFYMLFRQRFCNQFMSFHRTFSCHLAKHKFYCQIISSRYTTLQPRWYRVLFTGPEMYIIWFTHVEVLLLCVF